MRDGQKLAVIGVVCAAAVGAAGVGAYALVGGDGDDGGNNSVTGTSADGKPKSVETGPPSAEEVQSTSEQFLTAWQSGDAAAAADLTSDPKAAAKALKSFAKDGGATEVALTAGTPVAPSDKTADDASEASEDAASEDAPDDAAAEVPFDAVVQLAHEGATSEWTYESALTVVRDSASGKAVVDWQPSVLHPELKDGERIVTDAAGDPEVSLVDRNGVELTKEEFPELAAVLDDVRKRYADKSDGKPGVETRIVSGKAGAKKDADGKAAGNAENADDTAGRVTLHKVSEGTPGKVATTIDAALQKAAMKALDGRAKGSAVAVKPSTGEILAIANTPADSFNAALRGSLAPGSTMKVVTSSMLLEKGLAKSGAPHPCPKYFTHGGWKFQNLDKFEIKNGTFAQSFAASCNTAFISQAPKLKDDDLTKHSRDVFGLGLDWQVGTGTFDGAVPVQSDAQMAASLLGQGAVRMNPLTMASVAATVKDGTFKQPYLVSPQLDNRALAKAPRNLSPAVAAELRALMKTTATSGTAAESMASVGGDKGGKTGSAEVDGQKKPNAWFIGYRDDIAAAAVIPNSGHGGKNAGPVVARILNAG
ncbi:penicillin-binding transpeptidase domain-containing protein [Streptomyces sp. 549]|uniref:penicillin-binding transpeptidase domain-containing protein n=1 Tax=Streptomyces sp. 549 TaxID=3049076 RepID=UPI0024C457BF|nr:penicillin-binding transpeptidase domain-containing protein [Streptomyces sp. 549]MDK1476016.1 penicillin-binding transpeptidase domain-containing protein [Streptomyces sp. 549]